MRNARAPAHRSILCVKIVHAKLAEIREVKQEYPLSAAANFATVGAPRSSMRWSVRCSGTAGAMRALPCSLALVLGASWLEAPDRQKAGDEAANSRGYTHAFAV